MNNRNRKAQVAMEYLMTYGWAILVVLAVMAILVVMIKPQKPEMCRIDSPFQCEEGYYFVDTSGNLNISLVNYGSVALTVVNTTCGGDSLDSGVTVQSGGRAFIDFNCTACVDSTVKIGEDRFDSKAGNCEISLKYTPAGASQIVKTRTLEVVVIYS